MLGLHCHGMAFLATFDMNRIVVTTNLVRTSNFNLSFSFVRFYLWFGMTPIRGCDVPADIKIQHCPPECVPSVPSTPNLFCLVWWELGCALAWQLAKRAQNLLEQSRKLNENLAKQLSRNEPSSSTSVPVRTPDTQEPVTSVDIGSAPVSNQKQSVCCARLSLLQVAGLTVRLLPWSQSSSQDQQITTCSPFLCFLPCCRNTGYVSWWCSFGKWCVAFRKSEARAICFRNIILMQIYVDHMRKLNARPCKNEILFVLL